MPTISQESKDAQHLPRLPHRSPCFPAPAAPQCLPFCACRASTSRVDRSASAVALASFSRLPSQRRHTLTLLPDPLLASSSSLATASTCLACQFCLLTATLPCVTAQNSIHCCRLHPSRLPSFWYTGLHRLRHSFCHNSRHNYREFCHKPLPRCSVDCFRQSCPLFTTRCAAVVQKRPPAVQARWLRK